MPSRHEALPSTPIQPDGPDRPAPAAPRGLPIALVLAAAIGTLLLVVLAPVLIAGYRVARLNTAELVREHSELLIRSIVERTRSQLDPVRAQLEYLAELIARERLDLARQEQLGVLLLASLAAVPQESVIAFVSPELRVLRAFRNRTPPLVVSDWSDDPGFRRTMAEAGPAAGARWGELFVAQGAGMPFLNLFVPVRLDGRLVGMLIAGVSIEELSRFLGTLGSGQLANAFILYGQGSVLAHPRLRNGFPGLSDAHPLPSLDEVGDPVLGRIWAPDRLVDLEADLGQAVDARIVRIDGQNVVFLFRELAGYGEAPWIVGIYLPLDEAVPQLWRLTGLAWLGSIILLFALGLALLLGRALGRPIRRFAAAAMHVRELDLETPPAWLRSPFRELNEAADAYDTMLEELHIFATYVPRPLVRRLMRQSPCGAIASEEREISILFTDVAGFTAFAEHLPAAEVAGFLNQHFALVDRCVELWEGTIDKYIGDSVMAFWGAPEEQAEHAARACHAALGIITALRADNENRASCRRVPVRIRMGIHSGQAVVGNIGAPSRINYTVVGDVVNVAERLEELARDVAGEDEDACILVSRDTAGQLGTGFELVPVGRRVLRGRAGPLDAFRLHVP